MFFVITELKVLVSDVQILQCFSPWQRFYMLSVQKHFVTEIVQ